MTREEAAATIEQIGIFPGVRVNSGDHALFCTQMLWGAGIPVAEITMTVPGGIDVIRTVAEGFPEMVVGAGTVLDAETARRCLDAGARFITSTGMVPAVIEETLKANVVCIPGALTPTEVISCWKAGADFVKIFPAAAMGGDLYVRSLKLPLPQVKIIAAGGVTMKNAVDFIRAGSSALGLGMELLPPGSHPAPPESSHPGAFAALLGLREGRAVFPVITVPSRKKAQPADHIHASFIRNTGELSLT